MVFVPPVQSVASATALDLGQRLANVIREYQQTHPGTSAEDVRAALRIAAMDAPAGGRTRARIVVVAVVAAFLAATLSLWRRPGHPFPWAATTPMILVVVVILAFLALSIGRRG